MGILKCLKQKSLSVVNFQEHKPKNNKGTNIYLLTYSIDQSPSWEANQFSASQEIPRILWNPKGHYHIHKCPSPVPLLGQIHPV